MEKVLPLFLNMVDLPSFTDKVGKPTDPSLKGKKRYWGEGAQRQGPGSDHPLRAAHGLEWVYSVD